MSTQGKLRRNSIHEPPAMSDVNIMMLGLNGSGKSASGNTILGGDRNPFKEDLSPSSVTRVCESAQTEVDGQTVTVIDTVGLSDTTVKIKDAQTQIAKMLQDSNLDVFLLVIRLGETFRKESSEVVKWIQDNFGAELLKHSLVLFTHGDQLHEPIERYVSKCKALRSVVNQCSGGFHVFNNKDEDPSQVTELLKKINTLREKNQYMRYTEQDYKKTQDELLHRKCVTGVAVGEAGGVLVLGVIVAVTVIAAVVVSGGAAAGRGVAAGGGGVGQFILDYMMAAGGGAAAAGGGGVAGGGGRQFMLQMNAAGGRLGEIVDLARAAIASTMGAVTLTAGQAAIIGAAGVALLVVAVCAGVYLKKRKYI